MAIRVVSVHPLNSQAQWFKSLSFLTALYKVLCSNSFSQWASSQAFLLIGKRMAKLTSQCFKCDVLPTTNYNYVDQFSCKFRIHRLFIIITFFHEITGNSWALRWSLQTYLLSEMVQEPRDIGLITTRNAFFPLFTEHLVFDNKPVCWN